MREVMVNFFVYKSIDWATSFMASLSAIIR